MLYAVENGVIVHRNTRESGDGGFTVKMFADPARGGSGRIYYYAHLRAAGFYGDGVEVIAGDHLGEMGDTGNARGRGPHLHFQALEMIGGVATPLDVYDELRAALVVEQGEEVALKVATESGGSINCTIPPGETGVPAGGSGGGLLLGLALAAGGAYFLTRKR
jgi:murein DD-endopeptidase MepM/ murein hydrolase activator NlpD